MQGCMTKLVKFPMTEERRAVLSLVRMLDICDEADAAALWERALIDLAKLMRKAGLDRKVTAEQVQAVSNGVRDELRRRATIEAAKNAPASPVVQYA